MASNLATQALSFTGSLPGFDRFRRLYLAAAVMTVTFAAVWPVAGKVQAVAAAVFVAGTVARAVTQRRNFAVWTAACAVLWSLAVQMTAAVLPLQYGFWRELIAGWNAGLDLKFSVVLSLILGPALWLGLAGLGADLLDAGIKRAGQTAVEVPVYLTLVTIAFFSLAAPDASTGVTAASVCFSGVVGAMIPIVKDWMLKRIRKIDSIARADETAHDGRSEQEIDPLNPIPSRVERPKEFVVLDDEPPFDVDTSALEDLTAQENAVEVPESRRSTGSSTEDLTPDPSLWGDEEDAEDQSAGSDGDAPVAGREVGQVSGGDGGEHEVAIGAAQPEVNIEADMEGYSEPASDEAERADAHYDARRLVDTYQHLLEVVATTDDQSAVLENISTLVDMIHNVTRLSLEYLAEISHPAELDEWIMMATHGDNVDLEKTIHQHLLEPASDSSSEFDVPPVDEEPRITDPFEGDASGDYGATGIEDVPTQTQATPDDDAEDDLPSGADVATSEEVEEPVNTAIPDEKLTGDERDLIGEILEDAELLEQGLRAIGRYDLTSKSLNLIGGRVGALLRARWVDIKQQSRLQRLFVTVLSRVADDTFEQVALTRAACSIRFLTAVKHDENVAFLEEVVQRLQDGIDTREDYEVFEANRDRAERLFMAFQGVEDIENVATQFRNELDAAGRLYSEPLTPVVTELSGVTIDPSAIKRGMGHVLASNLDPTDRDHLEGFISIAKAVKGLEQRIMAEAMRRKSDVSTHSLYDNVMSLKQEALVRARLLQENVAMAGGGETRLRNMLLSGGDEAVEVFTSILASAQELESFKAFNRSTGNVLATMENQINLFKKMEEDYEQEKVVLEGKLESNLKSDSVEAFIDLFRHAFKAKGNAGHHTMKNTSEDVLVRLPTGPAQVYYRAVDATYAFCFIHGQGRKDWVIRDGAYLQSPGIATQILLKKCRTFLGEVDALVGQKIRMRFILVHGAIQNGLGLAFQIEQVLDKPQSVLKSCSLDQALEAPEARETTGPAATDPAAH